MNSLSRIGLSALLFSAFLILTGCNSESQRASELKNEKSSGFITVQKNNIDLGTILMSDGNVDIPFSFKNGGEEPVVLLQGETSCMCTTARVESDAGISGRIVMRGHGPTERINHVLDPDEEATLVATFDPNAHGPKGTGPVMRDVTLTTNSMRTPTVRFRFRGNVVP